MMKRKRRSSLFVIALGAAAICLSACSQKAEEKKEEPSVEQNEKTLTTVVESLCTVPDSKLQEAYQEAKEAAQEAASETSEPGAYGVYDFGPLLEELYGDYFTEQGLESIPYWIYTNLNSYAADRDVKVTVEQVQVQEEESSEGEYYTFTASMNYSVGEEKGEFEQAGTALFEEGKIENIYFNDGHITEIENKLF